VFFSSQPHATAGSGTIDFINPVGGASLVDGYATFTATDQPYYQYNQVLATNETSSSRHWRIHIAPTVTTFAFRVYVSAPVQYQDGWIDILAPDTMIVGDNLFASAAVRDFIGRQLPDSVDVVSTFETDNFAVEAGSFPLLSATVAGQATLTLTSFHGRTGTKTITVVEEGPSLDSITMYSGFVAGATMHNVELWGKHLGGSTTVSVTGTGVTLGNVHLHPIISGLWLADIAVDSGATGTRDISFSNSYGSTLPRTITISAPPAQDPLPLCVATTCAFVAISPAGNHFWYSDYYQLSVKPGQIGYIYLPNLQTVPFFTTIPIIFSCSPLGTGNLQYSSSSQTLFIDPITFGITNYAAINSLTQNLVNCKTFANGPVLRLGQSDINPRGYYLRFVNPGAPLGQAVVQMKLLAEETGHTADQPIRVLVYGVNVRP
jgi:hypothetical protein